MKRLSLGLALSLLLVGCGGSGNVPDPTPTQVQNGLATFSGSINNFASVTDPFAFISGLTGGSGTPTVTKLVNGTVTRVTIDYGSAPFDPGNGITRQGAIVITFDSNTGTGSVTFQNYLLNGAAVTGTIDLSNIQVGANTASFNAVFDVMVGSDEYKGTMSFSFSGTTYTINGTFTAIVAGRTYSGTVDNVVIDPGANGNSLPSSGSITFNLPYILPGGGSATATIKVTFDQNTPSTGLASVSINGEAATSLHWKQPPTP